MIGRIEECLGRIGVAVLSERFDNAVSPSAGRFSLKGIWAKMATSLQKVSTRPSLVTKGDADVDRLRRLRFGFSLLDQLKGLNILLQLNPRCP